MAGKFNKGALVSFMPTFLVPAPNVIVFQFNPETMTHGWTLAASAGLKADPMAVSGIPGEQFSFSLSLDATDTIADSAANPIGAGLATLSGVYPRLAALEMLLYPIAADGGDLIGSVSASVSVSASGISASVSASISAQSKSSVPRGDAPTVLFVWGPQRIVPVRVTAMSIAEKLYDTQLNPTHADVQITLKVLTPEDLVGTQGIMKDLAKAAYTYSQSLRQAHALANLGESAASVIGMLPTPF